MMHRIYAQSPQRASQTHFIYCNNEGLVTTLTQVSAYPQIYPNLTVSPEWDTIAQIIDTLAQLGPKQPHIIHFTRHQDERTPYEELLLPAQLNCNSDHLASKYLKEHPRLDHRRAPLFPKAECSLHLPQGTITREYKQEL